MGGNVEPLDITRLVAEHHAALYRYAYRLSGSTADAEDLTQQTFLSAHANLDQLRSVAAGRGWLFSILRNCYLKTRRKRIPLPAASVELDVNGLPEWRTTQPEIDRERLQAAIDQLCDEFKLVVLMFYFEGQSYREIAAALDLPIGTVMSRLSRAKSHLRRRLFEVETNERPMTRLPAAAARPR